MAAARRQALTDEIRFLANQTDVEHGCDCRGRGCRRQIGLGSACFWHVGFGVAPKRTFPRLAYLACFARQRKFATARTRSPARVTRTLPENARSRGRVTLTTGGSYFPVE